MAAPAIARPTALQAAARRAGGRGWCGRARRRPAPARSHCND